MYTRMDNSGVEDICYELEHVEKVLTVIKTNFSDYFMRFLDSNAGKGVSLKDVQELQKKFGIEVEQKKKNSDLKSNFKTIILDAVNDFERDRDDYVKIFRKNWLEDLDDDADTFKSKTLRN